MTTDFADAVLDIVASIPPGRVMSYGDIAAELGSRGARVVGRVMATQGSDAPWWRVVRANGGPPSGHESAALEHYRRERTPLSGDPADPASYRIRMRDARWRP